MRDLFFFFLLLIVFARASHLLVDDYYEDSREDSDGIAITRSNMRAKDRFSEDPNPGDPLPISDNNHWEIQSFIVRYRTKYRDIVYRTFDGDIHLYYKTDLVMVLRPNLTAMCGY